MKVRQMRVGPDAYYVDVFYKGQWVPMNNYCPTSLNAVRQLRRMFNRPQEG